MIDSWRRNREARLGNAAQLGLVFAGIAALGGLIFLVIFILTTAWQALALALIVGFVAGGFAAARILAIRGRESEAVSLFMATLMVFFPTSMLFLAGGTFFVAVMAVAICGFVTLWIVHPDSRAGALVLSVLIGGLVLALDWLALPWHPLNVDSREVVTAFVVSVGLLALVFAIYRAMMAYERIVSIQRRLTYAFIALVFTAAALVSITSIVVGIRNARQRAFQQLESVVLLKAQALDTWLDHLQFALESLIIEGDELDQAMSLLAVGPGGDVERDARSKLLGRFNEVMDRTSWYEEIFLITPEGDVVFSTDRTREGDSIVAELYFLRGVKGPFIHPPTYDVENEEISIFFARPLVSPRGTLLGVLAARSSAAQLNQVMVGEGKALPSERSTDSGDVYLVGPDFQVVTQSRGDPGDRAVHSQGIDAVMIERPELRRDTYEDYRGVPVLGVYTWIPRLRSGIVAELDETEVFRGAQVTLLVNALAGLLVVGVAAGASGLISRQITGPLLSLSNVAAEISQGNLDRTAVIEREDEIGVLAEALNGMTRRLRSLIGDLEIRVQERTQGLRAVMDVSRATSSLMDLDELLPRVVQLVKSRFDLYYVGLFLLDDGGSAAVLQAGTGEAGRAMLAEDWRLPLDERSMVGMCVATGDPLSKQLKGEEVVQFENPHLPETRSELALPLRYGEEVIGAMTVQSDVEQAFGDTDIAVFQNMADQVAVAVENARLFSETQSALERAHRAQQRYRTTVWAEYLDTRSVNGYDRRGALIDPLAGALLPEVEPVIHAGQTQHEQGRLMVPIMQGDEVVGVLGIERETGWSSEDVALVEALADQLALTANNQRLLDETMRREARERMRAEAAARMREPLGLEEVLKTAGREIRQALGLDELVLRIVEPGPGEPEA